MSEQIEKWSNSPEHKRTGKRRQSSIEKQKETCAVNKAIKNEVYTELKQQLLNGKAKPFYTEFISNYLAAAKKDPNSKAGQTVADTIFKQEILSLLDEQHDKEVANDREFTRYKLLKQFFKEQREVIYEINHSKKIIACCSRRAGKTDLASGAIVYAALIPNSRIIYMNLTYSNAINQIFENTIKRSNECGLTINSSSKSNGTIEWSNGSSLRVMGNSNNAEMDKLRGESKVSLVILDEFFHMRNTEYGINEVISPLMLDRSDSCILCIGTPPRIPHTFGEKCWNEKNGWKKFKWTFRDNPYVPNAEEFIDDICKAKGITRETPFIQREYYGIIGAYDTEAQVFKDYKIYRDIPEFTFTNIVIGVDIGFEDHNGIVALAYNIHQPERCYVLEERKFNKAAVSEIVENIKQVYNNSLKYVSNKDDVLIVCDNNNKELVYELFSVQKLPAYCCYKYNKELAIAQLSEWCRTGKINIKENGPLADEFERILYKRDEEDNILTEIDDDIYHPNIMFALLYASRQMWNDIGNELGGQSNNAKTQWVEMQQVNFD
jgi:hypothetical protein